MQCKNGKLVCSGVESNWNLIIYLFIYLILNWINLSKSSFSDTLEHPKGMRIRDSKPDP